MRPRSWVAQDSSRAVLAGIPLGTLASPTVAITHSGPRLGGNFFFPDGGGLAAVNRSRQRALSGKKVSTFMVAPLARSGSASRWPAGPRQRPIVFDTPAVAPIPKRF